MVEVTSIIYIIYIYVRNVIIIIIANNCDAKRWLYDESTVIATNKCLIQASK